MDNFCKGCGKQIEWQPHRDGRTVAIDPDPVEGGPLAFGPGMKLGPATAASKRRYRYHIAGCSNPEKARTRTDPIPKGCFRCGADDHWVAECPEAE